MQTLPQSKTLVYSAFGRNVFVSNCRGPRRYVTTCRDRIAASWLAHSNNPTSTAGKVLKAFHRAMKKRGLAK